MSYTPDIYVLDDLLLRLRSLSKHPRIIEAADMLDDALSDIKHDQREAERKREQN